MKRLVTQFDDSRSRATVATPSCCGVACCSCCSCCLATILSSSAITAMNVGAISETNHVPKSDSLVYSLIGFISLPAALFLLGWLTSNKFYPISLVSAGIIALCFWLLITSSMYSLADMKRNHNITQYIVGTAVLTAIMFILELYIGATMIISMGLFYPFVALGVTIAIIIRARISIRKNIKRNV